MSNDIQVKEITQITDEQFIDILKERGENALSKEKSENKVVADKVVADKVVADKVVADNGTDENGSTQNGAAEIKPEIKTETIVNNGSKEPETKKRKRVTLKDKFNVSKEEAQPETEKSSNPELEAIKSELQKLKEDPAVKLVLEAKKSNKNLIQALNELRGTSVSSMKDDDVFRQYCRDNGITEEEEIEDELEKFNAQSRLVKKEQLEKIKSQYLQEEENRFGQFFKNEPDPKEVKIIEKFQEDIVSHLKSMDEYGGVKVDDSMRKSIITDLQNNGFIPRLEDGSIDSSKMIDMIMWGRYKKMILDELEKEFTVIGAEMVQDEVEAKPASLVHNKPPDFARKAVTGEEKAKQASESLTYILA